MRPLQDVTQEWGLPLAPVPPSRLIEQLKLEATEAVATWRALPEKEPCDAEAGYNRVSVSLPLSRTLFHQVMNGPTGYRAHYARGIDEGETFNRLLVEALASVFIPSPTYSFDRHFCERSLLGTHSKIWFPKEITDLAYEVSLGELEEVLTVPQWVEHWKKHPRPRKGLLVPEAASILLNGTFISDDFDVYEQKPGRSKELYETGWV